MPQEKEKSNIVTTIAEYSTTAAELAKLKEKLAGAVYEVTTTAGMDTAKKDRRELVTLRTSLEAKRKEIKAPALERCKLIDEEAKRITAELLQLEQPIDAQIKAEEDRKAAIKAEKERIERERIAGIQQRIDRIRSLPMGITGMNSEDLTLYIAKVEAAQIGGEFMEFAEEAATVKAEVVAALKENLANLKTQEEETERLRLEREAEDRRLADEREKLAAERAEQERLQKIEQEKLDTERAELRRQQEEMDRKLKEAEDRERKRQQEEQAKADAERADQEKQRQEQERAEREKAEAEAAELRRIEDEKRQKEEQDRLDALTATHLSTLQAILDLALDQNITPAAARKGIISLAQAGIERGQA